MPEYLYQNPKTGKIISLIQSIHDKHEFFDKKGFKWNRVFTSPQLNTEGSLDANCTDKQFSEFTKNKKDTMGDLWDRSEELSHKREKIYGQDPVKNKYYKNWSKKRKGKKHPNLKKLN
jgi:hypothetical protein